MDRKEPSRIAGNTISFHRTATHILTCVQTHIAWDCGTNRMRLSQGQKRRWQLRRNCGLLSCLSGQALWREAQLFLFKRSTTTESEALESVMTRGEHRHIKLWRANKCNAGHPLTHSFLMNGSAITLPLDLPQCQINGKELLFGFQAKGKLKVFDAYFFLQDEPPQPRTGALMMIKAAKPRRSA